MDDQLLSDILTAEREIRLQIEALEQQTAERLETLKQELEQMLSNDSLARKSELEQALTRSEDTSLQEADALLAEARSFALRMEKLDTRELDSVVLRQLARILPEGAQ